MNELLPYFDTYLRQKKICPVCNQAISTEDYCVINLPQGIRVLHHSCLKEVKVGGCLAQIEIIYPKKSI